MAKENFLMYYGWYDFFKELSPEKAKELLCALFEYEISNGEKSPENMSSDIKPMFVFMRKYLDRSRSRYIAKCERNAENGKKGGERKAANESERKRNVANATKRQQSLTDASERKRNVADIDIGIDNDIDIVNDIDNDIDTDNDIDINIDIEHNIPYTNQTTPYNNLLSGKPDSAPQRYPDEVREIIEYLNLRTGKNYNPKSKANNEHINARLDEGYSIEDFKRAIDNEAGKWMGTDMEKYLRPSTLFNKEKFDGYVNDTYNEPPKSKKQTIYEQNTQMLDGWTNIDEVFDADEITPIEALPF